MNKSRLPEWLKKPYRPMGEKNVVEDIINDLHLNTVCREASCPNYSECFHDGTATIMIMGRNCTRNCAFCGVTNAPPSPLDPDEPKHVGDAVRRLSLKYIVITSVTRDDLPDGGASHFAATVHEIKKQSPDVKIEVLIPDFRGDETALRVLMDAKPDVISHNMETVKSLYAKVRPEADYERSLELIKRVSGSDTGIFSKSGIMVGVGETDEQVEELFDDLRNAGCEFLTIGQYLSPSTDNLPVSEFITPEKFDIWAGIAREKGFSYVASAPFVRSSYHAGNALISEAGD